MKKLIQTFEEACEVLGLDPVTIIPVMPSGAPEWYKKSTVANAKLHIIAEAMNKDAVFDWDNWDQYKYYPWFDMRPKNGSGLGLSFDVCDCAISNSYVGSRLCFLSREEAVHFGKHFIQLHADAKVRS